MKELRGITQDTETALIVDETFTGCGATGKGFWAYQGPADYVVFGKKTQITGFFSTPASKHHSLSFGGDQYALKQFNVIKEVIKRDKLIEKVQRVGSSMKSKIAETGPVKSVTGEGTHLYLNTNDG